MIGLIIAALAVSALSLVLLAILHWDKIIGWFQGRQALKESDKANIAFTLQEKLANGKYKTVQGIFNKRTNAIPDGVVYESEDLDEKTAEAHRNDELVVYN